MRRYRLLFLFFFLALFLFACNHSPSVTVHYKDGTVEEYSYNTEGDSSLHMDVAACMAITEAQSSFSALEDVVYYTESGGVWHENRACASLKNSKNVLSGSVEDAMLAGKSAPCKRCARGQE